MKQDIENNTDIKTLVNTFYEKIKIDPLLGPIFNNIMKTNWPSHLEKMYGFWEFLILKTGDYNGRPFPPHLLVNEKVKLTDLHFNRWITLFETNIDEIFIGENATIAKLKAKNIKEIFNHKLNNINQELVNIKN